MYKVDVGEYSTPTIRMLANVCELLQEQNKLLEQFSIGNTDIVKANKIENTANYDAMGRKELLAIIRPLPKGTIKGKYMTMELDELRKQVKEVMKCQE